MKSTLFSTNRLSLARLTAALVVVLTCRVAAHAQSAGFDPELLYTEPVTPLTAELRAALNGPLDDVPTSNGLRRHMFRLVPWALNDSSNLETDDALAVPGQPSDTPDDDGNIQLVMGADNPYLNFHRRGDAGGLGYERFYGQVKWLDLGSTSFFWNVEGVTPAGGDYDGGLMQGPSIFTQTVSCFHEFMEGGPAICGFVGRSARASTESFNALPEYHRNLHYGVGLQQPLLQPDANSNQQCFLFIEAMGRNNIDSDLSATCPSGFEMLPGVHWQSGDGCWLSGGVLFPFASNRPSPGIWQLTCSFQF
jgi:hypothetical protein